MRMIMLEEHYTTPAFIDTQGSQLANLVQSARGPSANSLRIMDQLKDLGDGRIAAMDAAGIDVQILSLNSPGVQQLDAKIAVDLARDANSYLSSAVQRHPDRFAGFATLPTAIPDVAVSELNHMVLDNGFKGVLINGHTRGRYLDDQFFWPILECAESLQVPIYLHPTPPPQKVMETYYTGNYPPQVASSLSTGAWGWHIETAIHLLRLILSGAFDRYPRLQIIIGHLGETVPFMLPRLNLRLTREITQLDRPIGAYLQENVFYTISGFNFTTPFLDLLLQVGAERIMLSADYPWGSMESARTFLEQLPISPADKERIAHGNAERILRL